MNKKNKNKTKQTNEQTNKKQNQNETNKQTKLLNFLKKLRNTSLSQGPRQPRGSRFAWSLASCSSCNLWSLKKL